MLLLDLFLLKDTPFRHAIESPRAPWYAAAFVVATGTAYGCFLGLFQRAAGVELQGIAVADIPLWLLLLGNILSGVIIAAIVHVGLVLFAWVAAKGIGGPGYMVALYRTIAYALPLAWPALPIIAARSAFAEAPDTPIPMERSLDVLAIVAAALFLAGLFHIFNLSQGKGPRMTALGVGIFALFMGGFLYFA